MMTQPSKTSSSDATGQPAAPRLGRLFLVPAPLDHGCAEPTRLEDSLPSGTLAAAAQIRHWICENARSARAYLKRISAIVPLAAPLQAQHITELPRLAHKKGIILALLAPNTTRRASWRRRGPAPTWD